MHSFDCAGCGIHVLVVGAEPHPENVLCLECRFLDGLDDDAVREEAREFFRRLHRAALDAPPRPEEQQPP